MTKDGIVARLRKLVAKAQSAEAIGNAAEAAAFAAKVEELLVRHELEMSDVELAEAREEDEIGQFRLDPEQHGLGRVGRRVEWQERLAGHLATAYFCRILVTTGSNVVTFVGRRSHLEVVTYVYARLVRECSEICDREEHTLWLRVKREQGLDAAKEAVRGWKAAFRTGFVSEVGRRLWEVEKARRDSMQAAGSGTALVRLADAHAAVRLWVEQRYKGHASGLSGGRSVNNMDGYNRGREAGQRASLGGNGVRAGGAGPRALTSGS